MLILSVLEIILSLSVIIINLLHRIVKIIAQMEGVSNESLTGKALALHSKIFLEC